MSRWKILSSKELFQTGFFKIREDRCQLPDGRVMPKYYVMQFPDWVNIVPVTSEGKVVLVRQYRHGAEREFLEVPGGSTHPGVAEDPLRAAERELIEETGFKSTDWFSCGSHFPNPSLQANRMHTYLALNCKKVAEPNLDPFEDLTVELLSLQDVYDLWLRGEFSHSIISASLALALKPLRDAGFRISV